MAANAISECMLSQVDDEGNRFVMFDEIADVRSNKHAIEDKDAFITMPNCTRRRRRTTAWWEVLIRWKDGSTTWNCMKDIKDSYPIQMAEYARDHGLSKKPAFCWWVDFVLNRRKRSLSKVKSKYWLKTHKYGIRIPKTVKEALEIDNDNGNHLYLRILSCISIILDSKVFIVAWTSVTIFGIVSC